MYFKNLIDFNPIFMKENLIKEESFDYALKAIELYKILIKRKEFILSKQFLRSSTSIGANVAEATAGFSKRDFIYKMGIASKEARESFYWIRLIEASALVDYDFKSLKEDAQKLIRILTSIVKTAQSSLK